MAKRVKTFQDEAINKIANLLSSYIKEVKIERAIDKFSSIVVCCMGTNMITGDSLGPLVGTLLSDAYDTPAIVYGTMDKPLHAKSIDDFPDVTNSSGLNVLKISIDASFGHQEDIGKVKIYKGGVCPGSGFGKKYPSIGDVSVIGIIGPHDDPFSIFKVKESPIFYMSEMVGKGVNNAIRCEGVSDNEIHSYDI